MRRSAKGWNDAAESGIRHIRGDRLFDSGQGESQEVFFEFLCCSMDHTGCISSVNFKATLTLEITMIKKVLSGVVGVLVLAKIVMWIFGSSVPGCGDKEVKDVLKKISNDNGLELISLSAITTKNSTKQNCNCTALAKFKVLDLTEETKINYKIELADNGKDFTVELNFE